MGTASRQIVITGVTVMEKTIAHVTNGLLRAFFGIVLGRKLDVNYLHTNMEILERGLRKWLEEKALQQVFVEVFLPGQDYAIERWDFEIGHRTEGPVKPTVPSSEQLQGFCAMLANLPARAQYRVVARTAAGATAVPGWGPTELLNTKDTVSTTLKGWQYGGTAVDLAYEGGQQ